MFFLRLVIITVWNGLFPCSLFNSVIKTLDFLLFGGSGQILTALHNLTHIIFNNFDFEILTAVFPIGKENRAQISKT